jgi:hypothetical protein
MPNPKKPAPDTVTPPPPSTDIRGGVPIIGGDKQPQQQALVVEDLNGNRILMPLVAVGAVTDVVGSVLVTNIARAVCDELVRRLFVGGQAMKESVQAAASAATENADLPTEVPEGMAKA